MPVLPWWAWTFAVNAAIIFVEYTNRSMGQAHGATGWAWLLHALPYTLVPIMVAQYGLFVMWTGAPSWYVAWIVFALGNSGMRALTVASTSSAGDVENWWLVVLGVAVMLGGSQVLKLGLR